MDNENVKDFEADELSQQSRFRNKKRKRKKKDFRMSIISIFFIAFFAIGISLAVNNPEKDVADGQQEGNTISERPEQKLKDEIIPGDTEEISYEGTEENSQGAMEKDTVAEPMDGKKEEANPDDGEKIVIHTIEKGDSLYRISLKYYNSAEYLQFLAAFNNITDSTSLRVGQELEIPFPPSSEWHSTDQQDDAMVTQDTIVHEVKSGETLSSISRMYYNTSKYNDFLAQFNGIEDARFLKVGDLLEIPSQPTEH